MKMDLHKQRVAAEAYQVIGILAGEADLFDHPEVDRALNYFGDIANGEEGARAKGILPFYIEGDEE